MVKLIGMNKIKVLIIDDSAVARMIFNELLPHDPRIEVVGTAHDPIIARQKIAKLKPDVLTLDIEMPRMNGLTFLEELMATNPIPVVMVSSLTESGCDMTIRALELGAVDFVTKPRIDIVPELPTIVEEITGKIRAAAVADVRAPRVTALARMKRISSSQENGFPFPSSIRTTCKVVAIGASTGGVEAIKEIMLQMPTDTPGIVVVQHMPEKFTRNFAERLNQICSIEVKEAEDGDMVIPGKALIAPGNYHMLLKNNGTDNYVEINNRPLVNRHRPSVDVLFKSVAETAGKKAIGVILTGMGNDGARGLKDMRDAGAYTIAQDESTSIVFGMPKEAIGMNAVDEVAPLYLIKEKIFSASKKWVS